MNDLLVRKYIQKYLEVKDMIYANLQTILKERDREGGEDREREGEEEWGAKKRK